MLNYWERGSRRIPKERGSFAELSEEGCCAIGDGDNDDMGWHDKTLI